MKKNIKKRVLSVLMAGSIAAGLMSGCGTKDAGTSSNGNPDILVYMPSITMGISDSIIQEINDKAGVNLKVLESSGTEEGTQRSALIITTGERVNWVNVDGSQPFKQWGEEGYINNLAPYLEKYKDELPTLNMIANDPIFKGFKGSNGEIYGIPSINYVTNNGLRMNKEWLKTADMEVPETTDDILEALRAFKSIAAKEDGGVPYVAGAMNDFNWVFSAFGGRLFQNGYPRYYEENGEFKPYDISDMHKEALKYIRTMYTEGLVNEDWQILSSVSGGTRDVFIGGRAGMIYSPSGCDEELFANKGTVTEWLAAPEGPTGVKSYGGGAPYWLLNVIPSAIESEEEILTTLKFIEWMHSEEARKLCCYGVEDVHYVMTEDGKVDRWQKEEKRIEDFGAAQDTRMSWGWVSPYYGAIDPSYGTVTEAVKNMKLFEQVEKEPVDENYMNYIALVSQYVDPYQYDTYISDDLLVAANTALEYVEQFYARAITEENFNIDAEWENFKKEYLSNYRGQECLDIFTSLVEEIDAK